MQARGPRFDDAWNFAFATDACDSQDRATPVFVDVDSFGLIDLDQVEEVLRADPGIGDSIPVHLFGHACDLERLRGFHERFGVTIIEDCAQSVGVKWKGISTGTVGEIACTSFYPTKNLGALGMVVRFLQIPRSSIESLVVYATMDNPANINTT